MSCSPSRLSTILLTLTEIPIKLSTNCLPISIFILLFVVLYSNRSCLIADVLVLLLPIRRVLCLNSYLTPPLKSNPTATKHPTIHICILLWLTFLLVVSRSAHCRHFHVPRMAKRSYVFVLRFMCFCVPIVLDVLSFKLGPTSCPSRKAQTKSAHIERDCGQRTA